MQVTSKKSVNSIVLFPKFRLPLRIIKTQFILSLYSNKLPTHVLFLSFLEQPKGNCNKLVAGVHICAVKGVEGVCIYLYIDLGHLYPGI